MTKPETRSLFEEGLKGLLWDWYKERARNIHQRVSAYDLLRRNGVSLRQVSDTRAEQIKCPFHGQDNKPSARVYPDSAQRSSHVWCYVCQKSWDVIGLQMEFGGLKFTQALRELEQSYGIEVSEPPKDLEGRFKEDLPDEALIEFERLHEVCERRLKTAKASYKALEDFNGYLTASSILDRIYFRVETRRVSPERGSEVLNQLLVKIGAKIQAGYAVLENDACPDG